MGQSSAFLHRTRKKYHEILWKVPYMLQIHLPSSSAQHEHARWYQAWLICQSIHLSNVAKVSFRIYVLHQYGSLGYIENISRKQGCIVMANQTSVGEEHGSMMVILPNGLIRTYDLWNRLVERKSLRKII